MLNFSTKVILKSHGLLFARKCGEGKGGKGRKEVGGESEGKKKVTCAFPTWPSVIQIAFRDGKINILLRVRLSIDLMYQ